MGNKIVTFTEQQLEDYQVQLPKRVHEKMYENGRGKSGQKSDIRFSLPVPASKWSVGKVHKRFRAVNPDKVPKSMTEDQASRIQVPVECIEKLPELKENPFRRRICEVFSRDGSGNMTFEDFLDLMSIFSEQAPRDLKVYYAFRIYDFDGDRFISTADLGVALRLLTRSELAAEELAQIAEKVVEEADVDGDGKLSYTEFEAVITRAPDFLSTFHMRI